MTASIGENRSKRHDSNRLSVALQAWQLHQPSEKRQCLAFKLPATSSLQSLRLCVFQLFLQQGFLLRLGCREPREQSICHRGKIQGEQGRQP